MAVWVCCWKEVVGHKCGELGWVDNSRLVRQSMHIVRVLTFLERRTQQEGISKVRDASCQYRAKAITAQTICSWSSVGGESPYQMHCGSINQSTFKTWSGRRGSIFPSGHPSSLACKRAPSSFTSCAGNILRHFLVIVSSNEKAVLFHSSGSKAIAVVRRWLRLLGDLSIKDRWPSDGIASSLQIVEGTPLPNTG